MNFVIPDLGMFQFGTKVYIPTVVVWAGKGI